MKQVLTCVDTVSRPKGSKGQGTACKNAEEMTKVVAKEGDEIYAKIVPEKDEAELLKCGTK